MAQEGSLEEPNRRDFLYIATATVGAVGAAAVVIPLISQMNPDSATIAAGAPVTLDISKVEPGQQIQVFWRSKPIFITNLSLIHISEPTRQAEISYAVFCLKKKNKK